MRKVRLGTVSFLLEDEPHTIAMNVDRACDYVARAAAERCDVVCLPEMVRTINVPEHAYDAEEMPGPTSERFARATRPCARSVNHSATTTGAASASPEAISFADAATTTTAARRAAGSPRPAPIGRVR